MLDREGQSVAWSQFMFELTDAQEHLATLIAELNSPEQIDDDEFAVHLGHVYAHLNRAWNSRNLDKQITDENWERSTEFPTDIRPIG